MLTNKETPKGVHSVTDDFVCDSRKEKHDSKVKTTEKVSKTTGNCPGKALNDHSVCQECWKGMTFTSSLVARSQP